VPDANGETIAPTETRAVAARAGLRGGDRKAGVEIELLAERSLLGRVGIFLRERNEGRAAVLRLHGADGGGGFRAGLGEASLADQHRAESKAREADQAGGGHGCNGAAEGEPIENGYRHVKSPIGEKATGQGYALFLMFLLMLPPVELRGIVRCVERAELTTSGISA
jgi:hypothetical protein